MRFHEIACDLARSHAIAQDRMRFCNVMRCSVVSSKNDKNSPPPPPPTPPLTFPHPGTRCMRCRRSRHQHRCVGHTGTISLSGLIWRRRAATMVRVVMYMMQRGRVGEIFCHFSSIRHYDTNGIAQDRMQSHAISCNRISPHTLCLRLSEFLKIHWEREVGMKVCPKCFFTTIERIYYYDQNWAFLKKRNVKCDYIFNC